MLVVGRDAIAGCEVEPLWWEPIHVAVPHDHRIAALEIVEWSELTDEHFIITTMHPGPEIHDLVMQHLARLGRRPIIKPRAVLREGLLALVGLGFGITLVGTAETAVSYPEVVFRRLVGEMLPFSAAWVPNNDNPALRRFLSLARARLRLGFPGRADRPLGGEPSRTPDPLP